MRFAITLLSVLVLAAPAGADIITFDTFQSPFTAGVGNQGWWSDVRENLDTNDSYAVGDTGGVQIGNPVRNFFTFDLGSLAPTGQTIVSATLELTRFAYFSDDPTETVEFFDVSTGAALLNNNQGTSAAIFNDLGTGNSYGSFVIPEYTFSSTLALSFALNDQALADIASAAGGFFSIGGSLQTYRGDDVELLFAAGNPTEASIHRLVLDVRPVSVPEPSSLLLLGLGGGAAALGARRRTIRSKDPVKEWSGR